jgi:hypothetical protein
MAQGRGQHLRRAEGEEGGREVAGAEHRHHRDQAAKAARESRTHRRPLGQHPPGIAGKEGEEHHAEHAGDQRHPEDAAKAGAAAEEEEGHDRPPQGAQRVQRLVEPESLAQVGARDRAGEHRAPHRLAQPPPHPGQAPRHHHQRPGADRDQAPQPEHGDRVAAHRQPAPPSDAVAVPAAPQPDPGRGPVGHPFHQAHRQGGRAQAAGQEERQHGQHHLVVEVGHQVGDTDGDHVAVEPRPPPSGGRLDYATTSIGTGRMGPPSLTAWKALPSTTLPFSQDTIT